MPAGNERPVAFDCRGDRLVGILHDVPGAARTGVVIVVGGPQYRVGSHRQFVLLARALASAGLPCLRFDYRGMGDSDGEFAGFENIGEDIRSAIDALLDNKPSLEEVVLWGLCDAASAILFYAHTDPRVTRIALANPWVRTETGIARTYLRHYYAGRLTDPAFWRSVARGEFKAGESLRSLLGMARTATGAKADDKAAGGPLRTPDPNDARPLPDRMAEELARFGGAVLLVLSGDDLTAREFEDVTKGAPLWRTLLAADRVTRRSLKPADHTFSRREWRDQVAAWTIEWIMP